LCAFFSANKNTPKKSASSSKASKKSASVSKTPKNSGNKITKYFTPKSSQSVESVVDNDKEINLARKVDIFSFFYPYQIMWRGLY
jgi:hypothetical protein